MECVQYVMKLGCFFRILSYHVAIMVTAYTVSQNGENIIMNVQHAGIQLKML